MYIPRFAPPLPITISEWSLIEEEENFVNLQLRHVLVVGICREHGKAYAVYLITVTKISMDGTEEVWDVYRRYSDFHDLHLTILERVRK